MNVCFAVQEMNVPMSQCIEWPIIVQLRLVMMSSRHFKSKIVSLLCVLWAKLPSFWRQRQQQQQTTTTGFLLLPTLVHSKTHQIYFHLLPTNPRFSDKYIHMNESTRCLLTEISFDECESDDCLKRKSAYSTLTNWFPCKIQGRKKIYICYVLYMVCIVFVKINQNRVLQEDVLVRGCMKRRGRIPRKKKLDYI